MIASLKFTDVFSGDQPFEWRVVLGSSLSNSGGSVHAVKQLILHPQYSTTTLNNDVAIVRLNNAAVYSSRVHPATIAGTNYHLADGTSVTHIGWGTLSVILLNIFIDLIIVQKCFEHEQHFGERERSPKCCSCSKQLSLWPLWLFLFIASIRLESNYQ